MIDYAEPLARATCDGAADATGGKLHCHFVDLVQPFIAAGGDMNPANFSIDGIHPSQAGQDIIAHEIFAVMKSQCLGQDAASGCCSH
jgi:lysophospholipase L1-like esterase